MVTGLRHVPPGRAGVLWLRHRLQVAQRGTDVLRRKLTMLVGERERLRRRCRETAAAWAEADRVARDRLALAAVFDGADALDAAADLPPMTVRQQWATVMGIRYADPPIVETQPLPADRPAPGGSALVQARAAYGVAAGAAARCAAAAAAVETVEAELAATRQRVRALDRYWIPRLREELSLAGLQMAEQESADAVRRLRADQAVPPRAT